MNILYILLALGIIGHAINMYCDRILSLLFNCDGGAHFGVVSVSPVPAESRLKSGFFARKALRDRLF